MADVIARNLIAGTFQPRTGPRTSVYPPPSIIHFVSEPRTSVQLVRGEPRQQTRRQVPARGHGACSNPAGAHPTTMSRPFWNNLTKQSDSVNDTAFYHDQCERKKSPYQTTFTSPILRIASSLVITGASRILAVATITASWMEYSVPSFLIVETILTPSG